MARRLGPLTLLAMLPLLADPASARTIEVPGVGGVEFVVSEQEPCTLGLDAELCVLTWDTHGTPHPGDDDVIAHRSIENARVILEPLPEDQVTFRPRDLAVQHPVFRRFNETWLRFNDSLPSALQPVVAFESRAYDDGSYWGAFVGIHSPVPIPLPGDPNPSYIGVGPVFWKTYPWLNGNITTDDEVRPLDYGIRAASDSDEDLRVFLAELAANCSPIRSTETVAFVTCPGAAAAREAADAGLVALQPLTPHVLLGASFEQAEVRTGTPGGEGLSTSGEAAVIDAAVAGLGLEGPFEEGPLFSAGGESLATAPMVAPPLVGPPILGAEKVLLALATWPADSMVAWGLLAGAAAGLASALYYRIRREHALHLDTRRRVYEGVVTHPGILAGTLSRRLGLEDKTVRSHLRRLCHSGVVEATRFGRQTRYFPASARLGMAGKSHLAASFRPSAPAVLDYLSARECASLEDICRDLGMPKSTASTTVGALASAGVVVKVRDGRRLVARLAPRPVAATTPIPGTPPAS